MIQNVISVHMTLLSEEAPLLVYHFWTIFLIHFSGPHLPSVNWCSLAHFVHSFTGDAPFSNRGFPLQSWGMLPWVMGDAPFSHWGRSLRSQGMLPSVTGDAQFGHWGCSIWSLGMLPSVATIVWYALRSLTRL